MEVKKKGPWKAVIETMGKKSSWAIHGVCSFWFNDEAEENAKLCAAAPELLEALQLARDYISGELLDKQVSLAGYPHKWKGEEDDLALIDAAIAKTTTGQKTS